MKKHIIIIATLFLFIVVLIGCGKKDTTQNAASINPDNLQSIDVSGEKIFLKYQFRNNEKLQYKLTTITNTLQTIKADSLMKSAADQTLTYIFDINVLEVDRDNIAELAINITSINFTGNINGQKMNYDSKKVAKEDKEKFAEFEIIVNSPFRVRINQKGEILDVTRLEKMIDKMIALRPEMKEMTSDQKSSMMKNITDGEIKPRTQLLFRELTSDQVAKDSTWQQSAPATLAVFQIVNTSKYKVDDFVKIGDDKAAKLSATLTSTWSGTKKGSQEGMNYLFDDPKVTGGGTILFNVDKGFLIKSETSTTIELGVQIDGKDETQKMRRTFRKDLSTNKNIVELL